MSVVAKGLGKEKEREGEKENDTLLSLLEIRRETKVAENAAAVSLLLHVSKNNIKRDAKKTDEAERTSGVRINPRILSV